MRSRRRLLAEASAVGTASLAGCAGLLEEDADVESEELDGDSTTEISLEKHDPELFYENSWVQNLEGGEDAEEIEIEQDIMSTRIRYGDLGVTLNNEGLGGKSTSVYVGSRNGEDVYRTFERTGYEDGTITIETRLAFEDGNADFGAYEEILES